MSRIEIEVTATHEHILRIRCFKDDHSSRFQDPHCLIQKFDQRFEWQVFDNVKPCDSAQVLIGHSAKIVHQIVFNDLQAKLARLRNQSSV